MFPDGAELSTPVPASAMKSDQERLISSTRCVPWLDHPVFRKRGLWPQKSSQQPLTTSISELTSEVSEETQIRKGWREKRECIGGEREERLQTGIGFVIRGRIGVFIDTG